MRLSIPLATIIALAGPTFAINAQENYPSRSTTYIIPYDPGGESDVTARFQEQYWSDVTGHDVVIQYKPGAGGATAWAQLNGYEPDGHTIMNVNFPHAILQPAMKDVGYATEDVTPAYVFHYTPDAIVVRADSPYQTLQDLIDEAKANPGAVTFGGSGSNSANHLAAVRFDQMADATTTYIPFKGSAPAMAALLGGQIQAAMTYSTQSLKAGGQVRTLAVATDERLPILPDVPTFNELGFDYVAGAYRGVTLPQGTPDDIRARLSDIIAEINAIPAFQKQLEDNGYVLVDVPASDMTSFIDELKADYQSGLEALKAAE